MRRSPDCVAFGNLLSILFVRVFGFCDVFGPIIRGEYQPIYTVGFTTISPSISRNRPHPNICVCVVHGPRVIKAIKELLHSIRSSQVYAILRSYKVVKCPKGSRPQYDIMVAKTLQMAVAWWCHQQESQFQLVNPETLSKMPSISSSSSGGGSWIIS